MRRRRLRGGGGRAQVALRWPPATARPGASLGARLWRRRGRMRACSRRVRVQKNPDGVGGDFSRVRATLGLLLYAFS